MIVGRADEREWKAECLRLEKKFADITAGAKEARKKNGYSNIETAKIATAVSRLPLRNWSTSSST
jgi:hypothetical protein